MQSRGRLSLGRVLGAELPADAVPCAVQLPGVEKRRPVHALDKLLNSYVITRIVTAAAATYRAVQAADGNRAQTGGNGREIAALDRKSVV